MNQLAYANFLVIAVTCLFSYQGFRNSWFERDYIFWPEAILGGKQYHRLITSGFLHSGVLHLTMNMLTLYFFGPAIEMTCGPTQFLVIYFASIVGGNQLSLYVHRHHDYRAYGASGGVCGIIYAHILLFPGRYLSLFMAFPIPAWLYAIGFLAGSFYAMKAGRDNVGHDAHLGGALIGFFTAGLFHPRAVIYSPWLFTFITLGTLALYFYLTKNPLSLPLKTFGLSRAAREEKIKPTRRIEEEVDAILQKISAQGAASLSAEEKELLLKASDKYRRRATRREPESHFPF